MGEEAPRPRRDKGGARRYGRLSDGVDQDTESGGAHSPVRVRSGYRPYPPSSHRASAPRLPGPGAGRSRRGGDRAFGLAR